MLLHLWQYFLASIWSILAVFSVYCIIHCLCCTLNTNVCVFIHYLHTGFIILLHLFKCFVSDLDELVPIRCCACLLRSHILLCVVLLLQWLCPVFPLSHNKSRSPLDIAVCCHLGCCIIVFLSLFSHYIHFQFLPLISL